MDEYGLVQTFRLSLEVLTPLAQGVWHWHCLFCGNKFVPSFGHLRSMICQPSTMAWWISHAGGITNGLSKFYCITCDENTKLKGSPLFQEKLFSNFARVWRYWRNAPTDQSCGVSLCKSTNLEANQWFTVARHVSYTDSQRSWTSMNIMNI